MNTEEIANVTALKFCLTKQQELVASLEDLLTTRQVTLQTLARSERTRANRVVQPASGK